MSKISSVYAKALFEIGKEENALEAFQEDLENLQEAFSENAEFSELQKEEQKALLVKYISGQVPIDVLHFLEVLIDNGRFHYLNEIINDFHYLANDYFGIVEMVLSSPVALEEEQLKLMAQTFGKKLNKEVRIKRLVDESLIGGYRLRMGDKVFDNSIKMKLKNLEQQMLHMS